MIGADHYRDGEERRGRIARPIEDEPDDAASHAGERSDLEKHMLVEDAAPQRLEGHKQNVASDSEDERKCQSAGEPWRCTRQISMQIEGEKTQGHDRKAHRGSDGGPQSARSQDKENEAPETEANQRGQKADPSDGRIGNDRNRSDAKNHREDEAPGFADQIAFLLFEGPELAGVGDRIADVAQGLQQLLRTRDSRVIFDQRLFMRQAHSDLVDARHSAERLLDGAGAERAMETSDPSADLPAIGSRRGLLAPEIEC
jgi:hypothetical protein